MAYNIINIQIIKYPVPTWNKPVFVIQKVTQIFIYKIRYKNFIIILKQLDIQKSQTRSFTYLYIVSFNKEKDCEKRGNSSMKYQNKFTYISRALIMYQSFNMYSQPTRKHLLLLTN